MSIAKTNYIQAVVRIGIIWKFVFFVLLFPAETVNGYDIVGFGDSITKGTPYVEEKEGDGRRVGGYEPELESLLGQAGKPSVVYNWGIGGEHTSSGVYRIDDVIRNYDHLDYILIMEGTNDIGNLSVSSTMFNLLRMIDRSHNLNVVPIIATLTPDTLNDRKKDYIETVYNPRIKDMAATGQVILADQYNATIDNWDSLNYDGVHPNRSGYRVLARTWRDAILSGPINLRPEVNTLDANLIDNTSVILNGSVNPNLINTTYRFEYGITTDYNHTTDSFNAGAGGTTISVSATISGLTKDSLYHYRIVATNAQGTSFGRDRTFSTGSSSSINTLEASNVSTDSARLNGSLDPEGNSTNYYFEYGTSNSYGQRTQEKNAGSGTQPVSVSEDIAGLANNTTYHFRLVSARNGNTLAGNDMTFATGTNQNNGSSSGCFIQSVLP